MSKADTPEHVYLEPQVNGRSLLWLDGQQRGIGYTRDDKIADAKIEVWDEMIQTLRQYFPDERLVRFSTIRFALERAKDAVVHQGGGKVMRSLYRSIRRLLGLHVWIDGQCRRCGVIWSAHSRCDGSMRQEQWDRIHPSAKGQR